MGQTTHLLRDLPHIARGQCRFDAEALHAGHQGNSVTYGSHQLPHIFAKDAHDRENHDRLQEVRQETHRGRAILRSRLMLYRN